MKKRRIKSLDAAIEAVADIAGSDAYAAAHEAIRQFLNEKDAKQVLDVIDDILMEREWYRRNG